MRRSAATELWLLLLFTAPALALARSPVVPPPTSEVSASGLAAYVFSSTSPIPIFDGAVTVSAPNGLQAPAMGYIPFWVELQNSSPAPQKLRIQLSRSSDNGSYSREVELRPFEARHLSLPLPAQMGGARVSVTGVEGRVTNRNLYFSTYLRTAVLALGSQDEFREFVGSGPTGATPDMVVLPLAVEHLPHELSALAGFSGVVLLGRELESLDAPKRRVLEHYAATGGLLAIEHPSRDLSGILPLLGEGQPLRASYGFGELHLCQADEPSCGPDFVQRTYARELPVRTAAPVAAFMRGPFGGGYRSQRPSDALLPQASPPVGRFLMIIVLFTLLVGPGSLWVARRKGPLFVLLTIPGTALVTCAGIAGYSALVDGFAVHATTRGFTLLDRESARAVSLGVEAFYANLAPGEARFSDSTAVLFPSERASSQSASIDWTSGARFGSDFIPSRTYREWGVLSVEPSRARLVVRPGERPRVQNALGGRIRGGVVSWSGTQYRVPAVEDGAEAPLVQQASGVDAAFEELDGQSRFPERIVTSMRAPLRDGEFLVQLEGSGGLPLGGLRLLRSGDLHVVRGEVD